MQRDDAVIMYNFKIYITATCKSDETVYIVIVRRVFLILILTNLLSSIAYSVAIGLFIAAGREVTGSIPNGKIVELEAMLANNPSAFFTVVKQWMNLQRSVTSMLSQTSHTSLR